MRRTSLIIAALIFCALRAGAVVKTSQEDGDWEKIAWWPAGSPQAGDTVVINTNVTGMPGGNFGELIVNPEKRLTVSGDRPQVEALLNFGRVTIAGSVPLRVMGNAVSDGVVDGDGTLMLVGPETAIGGGGTYGNVAINTLPLGPVTLFGATSVASLSIAKNNLLDIGSHGLTVRGGYVSSIGDGEGITASGGTVEVWGEIYGTIRGAVRIVDPPTGPVSKRSVPSISGLLGDTVAGVSIVSSRRIGLCTLIGAVAVDSGATLTTEGIGDDGWVHAVGTVTVYGTLTSDNEDYRWEILGDLTDYGTVANVVAVMLTPGATIRCDSGTWDNSMSLIYRAPSNTTLHLVGAMALSTLTIEGIDDADSNVVVDAGSYPLMVRHGFTSSVARNNRIECDSLVKLRSTSRGVVHGSTTFDGFWDAHLSGHYGRSGGTVRISAPKEIDGPFVAEGTLVVDKQYLLTVDTSAAVHGSGSFAGRVMLSGGARLEIEGNLTAGRGLSGAGTVRLLADAGMIDLTGPVDDDVLLEVGDGMHAARLRVAGSLTLPRLSVRAGSRLDAVSGVRIDVAREFLQEIAYDAGMQPVAPACAPMPEVGSEVSGTIDSGEPQIPGRGYWRRFEAGTRRVERGAFVNLPLDVPVHAGWNLIGGASLPASAARVAGVGTDIVSDFFLYGTDGSLRRVTELEPGHGYWVRVSGDGMLRLQGE